MRITSKQLRQIIREELGRMNEGRRGGRHGMDYGYGNFSGVYPRGGEDEGEPEAMGPSARELGWSVGDVVKSGGKTGTVTKVSDWDTAIDVEWEDGFTGTFDGKYMKKGR